MKRVYFLVSMARKSAFDLLEGAGFGASPPPAVPPPLREPAVAFVPAAVPAAAAAVPAGFGPAPLVDRVLRRARGLIAALQQRRPKGDKRGGVV